MRAAFLKPTHQMLKRGTVEAKNRDAVADSAQPEMYKAERRRTLTRKGETDEKLS